MVTLLLVVAVGCRREKIGDVLPVAVHVTTVANEDIGRELRYSASVKELQKVDLSFKVAGTVRELYQVKGLDGKDRDIQLGDRIPAGAVIAKLDDADYVRRWRIAEEQLVQAENKLLAARASADVALKDYGRTEKLLQQGATTQQLLDVATSHRDTTRASASAAAGEVQAAQIAAIQAKDDLENCELRVPAMQLAVVAEKYVERDERVLPTQQRAFLLFDVSRLRVAFGVPDTALGSLQNGQRLKVTCDALGGRQFAGRVSKIAAAADPGTRTFLVEVTIDEPQGLRPGMIATIAIGDHKTGILLPMTAIQRGKTKDDFVVYQVAGQGQRTTVRQRRVALDGVYDNRIHVVDGGITEIHPADVVVVSGASRLVEGQTVRVLEKPTVRPSL